MEPTVYLEFPDKPAPSCVNCGFLGVDWRTPGGESRWQVAEREGRTTGDFVRVGHTNPACWRVAADLRAEVVAFGDAAPPRPAGTPPLDTYHEWVLEVLGRHRPECGRFQPWTPRWTVEQHLEEHKVHLLEQSRREWEVTTETARRKYEGDWKRQWLPLGLAVTSIIVSAVIGICGASIQADATRDVAAIPTAAPQ